MEEGVHLVALVSSLESTQTREVIQRHLRAYIHQVRVAEASQGIYSSGKGSRGISGHIFIR
jgi:hypothetical protein